MARPGLIDGLKRWKVPDGSLKQLGRFIIEKCEEIWSMKRARTGHVVVEKCPKYSWTIRHQTARFSIQTGSFAVYIIEIDDFSCCLQLVADDAYSLSETYDTVTFTRNALTLEEAKSLVVDWFRRNRIAELIPGLID